MTQLPTPKIIQGGMGAGVSTWSLANAVARTGQLGVVAGTALDMILARRLQAGDPGGHMRRAISHFPYPEMAARILDKHFIEGGKGAEERFRPSPLGSVAPGPHLTELIVVSNFVEVWLAREGHDNPVGINYLEKIQLPMLAALFGSMLAGAHFVLMGGGIPAAIPGLLDQLSRGEAVKLRIDVRDEDRESATYSHFDPAAFCPGPVPELTRPWFLAIISTTPLARMMAKKASGHVDGFIVEGPTAGGHNAPPRGKPELSATGEPTYGERDVPDLEAIGALGRPFWLAGSYGRPEQLEAALALGATGVQVGTAFAYSEESGIAPHFKERILEMSRMGTARIYTDAVASPTGFPFKVVQLEGSVSDKETYESRERVCDLGYLRHAYTKESGAIAWRCPSEPVKDYLRKGGRVEDTVGRKCVCNALMSNIDLAQIHKDGYHELPLITSGDDVQDVGRFLADGATSYKAVEVVRYLLRTAPLPAANSITTPEE